MSAKHRIDPARARYQARGAAITLRQLLLQRYAAKTLEYLAHTRSIAGISGLHLSKMRGRGIDFEEFRPYQPGDDIRLIDWRVTARTSRPFTKVFREERERPVIIAVDQTHNMYFGSRTAFKSVVAAQAAALFCWLAIDNGDRVGGLVFSDCASRLVRPKRSRRSALHLLHQVHEFNQALGGSAVEEPISGADSGLSQALGRIRKILRPGSTLYVISDFVSLDARAVRYLNQLSQHNNVVCCFVYDVLEESLPPPGLYSITDGRRKGALNTFNRRARVRYREQFAERVDSIESDFDRLQVSLLKIRTDELVVEQIRQWITRNS